MPCKSYSALKRGEEEEKKKCLKILVVIQSFKKRGEEEMFHKVVIQVELKAASLAC